MKGASRLFSLMVAVLVFACGAKAPAPPPPDTAQVVEPDVPARPDIPATGDEGAADIQEDDALVDAGMDPAKEVLPDPDPVPDEATSEHASLDPSVTDPTLELPSPPEAVAEVLPEPAADLAPEPLDQGPPGDLAPADVSELFSEPPTLDATAPDVGVEAHLELPAEPTLDVAKELAADIHNPPDVSEPPKPEPAITEFMAVNKKTLLDEDGDSSDWIEIHNPSAQPLSLAGYRLTDNPDKPAKWVFPDVSIPPSGYLVVFASGKDRRDPQKPLHTNFKLDGSGETLQLVNPQGEVIQEFWSYPPQVEDASYGLATVVTRATLVTLGQPLKWHVPAPQDSDGWTGAIFDDSGWADGTNGVGFDRSEQPEVPESIDKLGPPLADSRADWSPVGEQGARGWYYGYWNRTADPDGVYAPQDFTPFPHDGNGYGPNDFWTGTAWDWYAGDPPWTALGDTYVHPSGVNNGVEHWPIRRYKAWTSGPVHVLWRLGKSDPAGYGVTGYVFHNGALVDQASVVGTDTNGIERRLTLPFVAPGDYLDFAVGPAGPGGEQDDSNDSSFLTATLWLLPEVATYVTTDVGDAMAGKASSLRVRLPFEAENLSGFNRLFLHIKYDDGFSAWLNGTRVAYSNVSDPLTYDSTALQDRLVVEAVSAKTFDLKDYLPLLSGGKNVLALQGVNSATDDRTFLLAPELEARRVVYVPGKVRYFGHPTPGADNEDGPCLVPPVVEHLTNSGELEPGEPLVVKARITPTCAESVSAVVYYRVMFGQEVAVPMTPLDNGLLSATIEHGAGPGKMVRWYIKATDSSGAVTRSPPFLDALDSEQYYGVIVRDDSVVSNLPVFHLFVENTAAADTRTGTRASLYYNGEFYDNVRIDLHGQSTAGFPKKGYDVDFNEDHRFRLSPNLARMKDINLLTNYADKSKVRNTLAYETLKHTGTGYHLAFPVRLQRNGTFFQVSDFVEDPDDRWLERLGLDPEAPLYKMYDNLSSVNAAEKKNRKWEDKSDLQALINGLGQTGQALRNFLYDNINIAAMVNFHVGLTIIADMDCCHKNYYAYRDVNGTLEWWYLPWDVDLSFGRNWIKSKTYFDDTMHPDNPLFSGTNNRLTGPLMALPEFKQMYLRRLRTVMDMLLQPPGTPPEELAFERRIDELVTQIGYDGFLDFQAWPKWGEVQTMEVAANIIKNDFLAPRRIFLYQTQSTPGGGPIPGPQGDAQVVVSAVDLSPQDPSQAWIALENPNDFAVDLSGWMVTANRISMRLWPGTVIPAKGTLYLTPDAVAFRSRPTPPTGGQGLFVQGNWQGVLIDPASITLTKPDNWPY